MKKKKRLLHFAMLIFILLPGLNLIAQQTINGTLRSPSGDPVPGATIKVRETNKSALSNDSGRFRIDVSVGNTLIISSVGFQPRQITVTGNEINETLEVTNATLNDVVVIGYQSVRRKDLTGATGIVNMSDANRITSAYVGESIQGLVPGVTVRNTGAPGQKMRQLKYGVLAALAIPIPCT